MRAAALEYLSFGGIQPAPADLQVFRAEGDEVVDGALWVNQRWFRIEHGILDALPAPLASGAARRAFAERHGLSAASAAGAEAVDETVRKVEQIEFFREDAPRYDHDVSLRSFYVASDRISYGDWIKTVPGQLVCDIGAGTGRLTLPMAERGLTVVSTDISEEMVRLGRQRAVAAGVLDRITFVLADAEELPFKSGIFDAASCYGALHHVPNPGALVEEAGRLLRDGGRWLSYDPHRSAVRFIFEWTMRVRELYAELANGNPLISRDDVLQWCRRAGIRPDVKLHFFLPPHVLTLLPPDTVERLLRLSDRVFNGIGLGSFAGVIIVTGTKSGGGAR